MVSASDYGTGFDGGDLLAFEDFGDNWLAFLS